MQANGQRTKVEIMGAGSNQQIDFGHWILRNIAFVIDSIIIGIVRWELFTFATIHCYSKEAYNGST